jgi:hypothetical protein
MTARPLARQEAEGKRGGGACTAGEENGDGGGRRGGAVVMAVVLNPTHRGGGRADGVVPRGKRGGGGAWGGAARRSAARSASNGPSQAGGAVWPCHAAGPNRGGGRLTGGVRWHNAGRCGQMVFKPFQNGLNRFKQTSNCSNFNQSKNDPPSSKNLK